MTEYYGWNSDHQWVKVFDDGADSSNHPLAPKCYDKELMAQAAGFNSYDNWLLWAEGEKKKWGNMKVYHYCDYIPGFLSHISDSLPSDHELDNAYFKEIIMIEWEE